MTRKQNIKEDNKIGVQCNECGKKFKRVNPSKCPKCGGYDLDVI